MLNRRHIYVGSRISSDGLTTLDARIQRNLKAPVNFWTAGPNTRTHHLQVAEDLMLVANGANIVTMQSYDNERGYSKTRWPTASQRRSRFRAGLPFTIFQSPRRQRRSRSLQMPGLGINRLWWMGALCLCCGAFRRYNR